MIKLLIFVLITITVGYLALYAKNILLWFVDRKEVTGGFFYKHIGSKVRRWNISMERATIIKKDGFNAKINRYFKDMITNLDMDKDNVTPAGLITFLIFIDVGITAIFVYLVGEWTLAVPTFCAVLYFEIVIFKFFGLMRFEQKEARIMDVEDLIAMDIKGGVYNAIVRYYKSFHPSMRPYFEEFVDNIRLKGYPFRQAMQILNDQLGPTFNDFAKKAIQYEEKADDDMVEIFSSVVDMNRNRRTLRQENNKKFRELRTEFLLSIAIIAGYFVFAIFSDDFFRHFFSDVYFGKVLLICDIVAIAWVLAYIAAIKAKFL